MITLHFPSGRLLPAGAVLLSLLLLASCTTRTVQPHLVPAASLLDDSTSAADRRAIADRLEDQMQDRSPYMKAHMQNGHVYVLSERTVDAEARLVRGTGVRLDVLRDTLDRGEFTIPIDSVALFETNVIEPSSQVGALALIAGASVALTVYCLIDTKACFGSCPTFYVSDGDSLLLQAEGFSASIAPSLEATDVDALYRARPAGATVRIEMRNEALETHVVRHADLLLAPRPGPGRVLADVHGAYRHVPRLHPPRACAAEEGDCRPAVQALDANERYSLADSTDLAAREMIDLEFDLSDLPGGPDAPALGLAIGARQTLLTTYLLYQTLAYMGREAGAWLARLERADATLRDADVGRVLGGIEVLAQDASGAWTRVGEVFEHGPLATDVHLIPLPPLPSNTVRLRLRLTRGNWRLDYVALAELGDPVEPIRLSPAAVYRDGALDAPARALLTDPARSLTTLPGDTYTLVYEMPPGDGAYELFLESRGYYLEWIREEWLKEEDPQQVAQMLFNPRAALKELAPAYKKAEPHMEAAFWRSRYVPR